MNTIQSDRLESLPYDASLAWYRAESNSIGPFLAPTGGFPIRRALLPFGLSDTTDMIGPYLVGLRISAYPMNRNDTRRSGTQFLAYRPLLGYPGYLWIGLGRAFSPMVFSRLFGLVFFVFYSRAHTQ